jgi:uncharacterized protein (DUF1330 family)
MVPDRTASVLLDIKKNFSTRRRRSFIQEGLCLEQFLLVLSAQAVWSGDNDKLLLHEEIRMSTFFLTEITKISDAEMFGIYIEKVTAIINKYGGEYIFESAQLAPVSGEWDAKKIILIRFENKGMLSKCFQSEDYKKIAQLRKQSTESKAVIIED